ncbi:DUF3306 domain-containing protein [Shewanella marinintestina]|uniref:DUF3306 domain-containing protein n=1 Tax=Shewanella marinintestina TaxID=190305 RepID=UPI002010A8E5|nr:DUF3306 domain-containing protein [Shewanella marinintestina]MCL1147183.1 DUF3306 domain-containing protein [Shewanella marinintestina]
MSGFLSRWNLRKQQVEAEGEAEVAAAEEAAQKLAEEQALAAQEQAESEQVAENALQQSTDETRVEADPDKILTAEDLPDPEKIEVGGSFASFMGANVDPATKSAALKALWKQPHYNEIDGLLEYALDYSNQPLLTPDVSAEIAKKVFRHMVKDKDEEKLEQDELDVSDEMIAAENSVENKSLSDTDAVSDILDAQQDSLSQNEPKSSDVPTGKVV